MTEEKKNKIAGEAAENAKNAGSADTRSAEDTKKPKQKLQKLVDELNDKLSKEKDDYCRLMAEFDTFRRRSREEKMELVSSASAETIKGLLPVLDDCEQALKILAGSADTAAIEGTTLIYNKLKDYLKTKGLEPIDAQGKDFDTDFHEAVTKFPAPSPEMKGKVIDVIQTGYTLSGKILRYAKVVVGE